MAGRVWEVYLVRAKYLPLFLATRAVQTETLHAIFLLVVFTFPCKSVVRWEAIQPCWSLECEEQPVPQ